MKIAAAYIRVSTDDQIEYSPESQIKAIREYAKKNDYILPEEYIFIDEGISGRNTKKRVAFQSMIGLAKTKPKPFDAILLWKFSRFARSREDSIVYKSMLRKQLGIDVISISENLGDDKMSVLFESMIEAMDEYYSINLAEEVKRGMTEKANRGEPLSVPPYGYQMSNGNFVPNEKETEIVRQIFTDFINGAGMRPLAHKANSMGATTHRGNPFENRTINYILNNPTYVGQIRWNPNGHTNRDFDNENLIITQGTHEPIISQDVWDKAQKRLKDIKSRYKKYVRTPDEPAHIFQGIIKCSTCGSTLVHSANGLQCHLYAKGRCSTSHYISIKKIEESVISKIENDFLTGNLNIIPRTIKDSSQNEYIEKQIEKETHKLSRVKEAYEKGVDSIEEYAINKKRILADIESLKKKLVKSPPDTKVKSLTERFLAKNKNMVKKLRNPNVSTSEKNTTLKLFVDEIIYDKKTETLDIAYYI